MPANLLWMNVTCASAGPIWMDNVVCRNTAELLDDCNFPGWGVHNCDHSDDYSVVCQPTQGA